MQGIEIGTAVANRLATAVKDRRAQLGLTQPQLAERSSNAFKAPTLQSVEGAHRTNFSRRTLLGLCRALGWTDDSIELVVAGGEPVLRSSGYASDELLAAVDEIRSGVERLERALANRQFVPASP